MNHMDQICNKTNKKVYDLKIKEPNGNQTQNLDVNV